MSPVKLFQFSAILLLFASCGKSSPSLPGEKPSDLRIDYHLDGGMNDYSVDINIFGDSCHYRKRLDGKVNEKTFKLSAAELNRFYASLKANEFDKITFKAEKGIVYDRGGIDIGVKWNANEIKVSDAQNSFIDEKWYVNWKTICEEIDQLASNKAGF